MFLLNEANILSKKKNEANIGSRGKRKGTLFLRESGQLLSPNSRHPPALTRVDVNTVGPNFHVEWPAKASEAKFLLAGDTCDAGEDDTDMDGREGGLTMEEGRGAFLSGARCEGDTKPRAITGTVEWDGFPAVAGKPKLGLCYWGRWYICGITFGPCFCFPTSGGSVDVYRGGNG